METKEPANRPRANVYHRNCPSRTVLDLLSDKWTMLIICVLAEKPHRFGDLRRGIDGVTQKMLTQTLRAMERNGLLTRTVHPTSPPSVEYALTRLGKSCIELMDNMRLWAERHTWQIVAAREAFDQASEPVTGPGIKFGKVIRKPMLMTARR